MIITVASGKGGTGKTTVAVSLALSLASVDGGTAQLFLDCDVEAPNAALFLNPVIRERRKVGQMVPVVDLEACTQCGRCAEVCQFNAIAVVGDDVLVFPELCHACGSCALNCPTGAIHEELDVMGVIERGSCVGGATSPGAGDSLEFAHGILNVGEMMAVPVIHQLKQWAIPPQHDAGLGDGSLGDGSLGDASPVILDAPPGNACPVVEVMQGSDFVLLVTEPTPFGLHDLKQAVEVARDEMGLPVGVVINREGVGDQGVDAYCEAEGIPILMRIPLEREIAEAYSDGVPLVEALPHYGERFRELYRDIESLVAAGGRA
jgi:MinD superfamily P-loop ATPase